MSQLARKGIRLLARLAQQPAEALNLLGGYLQLRWERLTLPDHDYAVRPWDDVATRIEEVLGRPLTPYLAEPSLRDIDTRTRARRAAVAAFPPVYSADRQLAALAYALCRALRPGIVVATGVAWGLLSAFVLQALDANGSGVLHDVDRPPLEPGAEQMVGALVPDHLKGRWVLHRGVSRRVLPPLLRGLRTVGIFIHDSHHTRRNILRELRAVQPYLARPAVVIVDDVNLNPAFYEWTQAARPAYSAVLQQTEKDVMCGVAVFAQEASRRRPKTPSAAGDLSL